MKRKMKVFLVSIFMLLACCFSVLESAHFLLSAENASVSIGTTSVATFEVDPYSYTETVVDLGDTKELNVIHGQTDIAGKVAVFTCNYQFKTTKNTTKGDRVEYSIVDGKVTAKAEVSSNQSTYIPVGGYVVSFPKSYSNASTLANVGDKATISNIDTSSTFVESVADDGTRIAITKFNGVRSSNGVVYYDYTWGKFTSTNQWGTEMVATLDKDTYNFKINRFRKLSEGDAQGISIPDQSFVLSSYGTPYRGYTNEGVKFNLGDEVKIVGFDYIRLEATTSYKYSFVNPNATTNPAGIDSSTGQPYPAFRGVDQLNIYTSDWGATVGANEWGYEIAVDSNGVIVEKGVNVSAIPQGGFVASGHGAGRDFLQSSAPVGANCSYSTATQQITVKTTPESYIVNGENELLTAKATVDMMVDRMYDIDATEASAIYNNGLSILETLRNYKTKLNDTTISQEEKFFILVQFNDYLIQLGGYADKLTCMTTDSKVISGRSLWHRPKETDLDGIKDTIAQLKACNFNMVFLETFWNGYSMFPSKNVTYHYQFANYTYGEYGKDYLKAFISEAHKEGIEVHAWVESFYVGVDGIPQSNILTEHPEWTLYAGDGSQVQKKEGGKYIFADPANEEVQAFLIDYFKEMISNYELDGMQLDYIRYPVSSITNSVNDSGRTETDLSFDNGYTEIAAREFLVKYGYFTDEQLASKNVVNELKKKLNASYNAKYADVQKNWQEYKTSKVTEFVKKIYNMKNTATDRYIYLSASVFASQTEAIIKKNQDWPTWFLNGWIDIACPMAYYNDASEVLKNVKEMVRITEGLSYNYAGIAPTYKGLDAIQNALQVEACLQAGALGSSIFASQNVLGLDDVKTILSQGSHSKEAIAPQAPVADILDAAFADILSKSTRIYMANDAMSQEQYNALNESFEMIKALPTETTQDMVNVMYYINKDISNVKKFAVGYANKRIQEDLEYLNTVLDYKLSRTMIKNGEWNPEENKTRPVINPTIEEDPSQPGDDSSITSEDTNSSVNSDSTDTPNGETTRRGCKGSTTGSGAIALIGLLAIIFIQKRKEIKTYEKN